MKKTRAVCWFSDNYFTWTCLLCYLIPISFKPWLAVCWQVHLQVSDLVHKLPDFPSQNSMVPELSLCLGRIQLYSPSCNTKVIKSTVSVRDWAKHPYNCQHKYTYTVWNNWLIWALSPLLYRWRQLEFHSLETYFYEAHLALPVGWICCEVFENAKSQFHIRFSEEPFSEINFQT